MYQHQKHQSALIAHIKSYQHQENCHQHQNTDDAMHQELLSPSQRRYQYTTCYIQYPNVLNSSSQ